MSIENEMDQEPEEDEKIADKSIEEVIESKPDKGTTMSEEDREKCLRALFKIFGNAIVQLGDDPTGPTILEFDHKHLLDDNGWHNITQEESARGYVQISSVDIARTTNPVGTGIRHSLKLDLAVSRYFPVLVSDEIPDDRKLDAMIEYDELHGIKHAPFFRGLREAGII